MASKQGRGTSLIVDRDQAIVGFQRSGETEGQSHYLVEDAGATQNADQQQAVLDAALGMIGAWRELDWQDMIDELDRQRHEVGPTPPIEL